MTKDHWSLGYNYNVNETKKLTGLSRYTLVTMHAASQCVTRSCPLKGGASSQLSPATVKTNKQTNKQTKTKTENSKRKEPARGLRN